MIKWKTISDLRTEFWFIVGLRPRFLKDKEFDEIWSKMEVANGFIMILICERFLSRVGIKSISKKFDDHILTFIEEVPSQLQIQISFYYTTILDKMWARAFEEEHYEVAKNLKEFSDIYFVDDER